MSKIFVTIGNTSTQSVEVNQPVWVLLPQTLLPAVVSTYSRQLYSGVKVLLRLGSVRNIFHSHLLPHLSSSGDGSLAAKRQELASLNDRVDAMAGDVAKRAQIFLSFLSSRRLIDRKLYPIVEKVRQKITLTSKDISSLVDAIYVILRKTANATSSQKQKLRDYIQTGAYDAAIIGWLARFVDPTIALHLRRDDLAAELRDSETQERPKDNAALERELRHAVEQLRAGVPCADEVCGIDVRAWLGQLIGCKPEPRFFATVGQIHQGLNKSGCLNFDQSKSFHDFGESAPRFLTLDKLSRSVTALDRGLSHLTIAYANDDAEMKELCRDHAVHSGLLIRGLLGENDAIKTLYPSHAVAITNQPDLGDVLIAKIRTAYEDGSLVQVCAPRYGIAEEDLRKGIAKAVSLQRQLLPLVPMEVHRLADAIETRIRLRKIAEKLPSSGDSQQTVSLDLAIRAQSMRQTQLSKTLKTDFRIDPARLFFLDDLLIDRMKALFGNELEFLRTVLAPYLEKSRASGQSPSAKANSGSAINS